jgi:hypothetical protein
MVHGTMFNRDAALAADMPFQWSHFVFDPTNELMYAGSAAVEAADGYDYDGTFIFRDFVADPNDANSVYCMAENRRYQDTPARLLKCTWRPGTTNIYVRKLTVPYSSEWQSRLPLQANEKSVFGITGPTTNGMWEFSTDFYPRIELAKFSDTETIYDVLKYIAEYINSYLFIHADRFIRFVKRDTYTGTESLQWHSNMVQGKPRFEYWEFTVDSVSVQYESQVDDQIKGTRKLGFDGWQKKTLSVSNPLIQNVHAAQMIVDDLYKYFRYVRYKITDLYVVPLFQLECTDRFNVYMHSRILEFDPTIYFLITSIRLDSNKQLKLEGIEIIPESVNS